MKSDFMERTAKIIAEISARTCIDDDAEVIKDILRNELRECYDALNEYYDDGYAAGYERGYERGGNAMVGELQNQSWTDGYDVGYAEGYADCRKYSLEGMDYIGIDTVSLKDFADILMNNGVVRYETICYNSRILDVTVGGINISNYLPKEYHRADGTVHVQEPSEGNLIGLLAASDGKVVTIYNHECEVFRFTIEDGLVHYASYKIFEEI